MLLLVTGVDRKIAAMKIFWVSKRKCIWKHRHMSPGRIRRHEVAFWHGDRRLHGCGLFPRHGPDFMEVPTWPGRSCQLEIPEETLPAFLTSTTPAPSTYVTVLASVTTLNLSASLFWGRPGALERRGRRPRNSLGNAPGWTLLTPGSGFLLSDQDEGVMCERASDRAFDAPHGCRTGKVGKVRESPAQYRFIKYNSTAQKS